MLLIQGHEIDPLDFHIIHLMIQWHLLLNFHVFIPIHYVPLVISAHQNGSGVVFGLQERKAQRGHWIMYHCIHSKKQGVTLLPSR